MKKQSLLKRLVVLIMALLVVFSLTACGGTNSESGSDAGKEEKEKAIEVTDEKYAELLAGGLNKEQFEFILAHMPGVLEEGALTMSDLSNLLLYISEYAYNDSPEISIDGWTEGYDGNMYYNLSDVNNMIKIATDFQFAEENNGQCRAASVTGDTFVFSVASPAISYKAVIKNAMIEKEKMTVFYTVEVVSMEEGTWSEIRTATLGKTADGLYQIKEIDTDEVIVPTWQEQYKDVILKSEGEDNTYTLHDMDGDGQPELILSIKNPDFDSRYDWAIYTCNTEKGLIKEIETSYATGYSTGAVIEIYINPNGPGFVNIETARFNGETFFSEMFIVDGEIETRFLESFTWEQESALEEYEANFTEKVEWTSITDLSLLNQYQ